MMVLAVCAFGLLLLGLWSLSLWAVHAVWEGLAGTPWAQAPQEWMHVPLPGWVEPWFGPVWREWQQALAPVLEWLGPILSSSFQALGGAVPTLLWVAWAIGALLLLALTAAAAAGASWWRSRRTPSPRLR